MAKLKCEDKDLETSFEINFKAIEGEWQEYEIVFNFADEKQVFSSKHISSEAPENPVGKFVFAVKPKNRVELFINLIENFINNDEQKELCFEPADPSFEMILKRSHAGGFQAYLWVDCGNTKQLCHTWDAKGIRFFTTQENLVEFAQELRKEASVNVTA